MTMSGPRDEILDALHQYRQGTITLAEHAADKIIEVCAKAAEQQDRTGREWVRDSLWEKILERAGSAVRALKFK